MITRARSIRLSRDIETTKKTADAGTQHLLHI
jgi:hypothetical protein